MDRAPVKGIAEYRRAVGEWLIRTGRAVIVPIPGSGPCPSALGYQLERLEIYSRDENGREIPAPSPQIGRASCRERVSSPV